PETVDGIAQRFLVDAVVEPAGEDADAGDGRRFRRRIAAGARGELRLELLDLAFEGFRALQRLADAVLRVGTAAAEQAGDAVERVLGLADARERRVAGDRLDAPDAGGNTGFRDDPGKTDVTRTVHVGAAAELGGEPADGEHAHLVAVLLAEQRHGAGGDGVVVAHDAGLRLGVGTDLRVDEIL